jgi:16S rRNA processing protein RimM
MGRVAGPWGVKGWIKVQPFTAEVDGLCAFPRWWIGGREIAIEEATQHGATVIAKLAGLDVREDAARLKGAEVSVPRDALPPAGEDEFYWDDLVGLELVNLQDEALGQVTEVFSNGAHDILRVEQEDGPKKRERLVPFVDAVVREVSLKERRIRVDWGADW